MSQDGTHGEFVSIVVPVDNPSIDVAKIVEGYSRPFREAHYPHELIFVLDGVRGRVADELAALAERFPVKVVRLQGDGLGESIALSAGAAHARGAFILNVPQYLQIEPDDLVKVVKALENGADFVATWRHPRVDPWLNRLQSRLFNWVLRVVMGIRFHDLNSSVRGMRRQVLDEVNVYGEMFRFLPVLAQRQGFHVVEVKVRHREEHGLLPFYGVGVYVRRVLDILAISFLTRFRQKPLRFFGILGVLSILVGIGLTISPLLEKLGGGSLQDRPVFVLGVILVAFGVQLICFGLVGEIIIFTQAGQVRDYKIEELLDGGVAAAGADGEVVDAPLAAVPHGEPPLRVRELLPGEDARWDSFVRQHPDGSFFHLTGWRRAVEETFHHEPHYLLCEQGRTWRGVLPVFWVRSPFLGRQMISLPYAVYGGVLALDEESTAALVEAACAQGRRLGAGYLELRHDRPRSGTGMRHDLYVTFRKELPARADDVLPAIPKKARAEVRRARDRFGMSVTESDDLAAFFSLFADEKRRLGTPSLPFAWFENLRNEFGRSVVLHVVRDAEGRPVSSVMSFLYGQTVYAYYSGSAADARGTGVADFMYCRIMEWAVERGFRVFDFGRSRRDSGAAKFKRNMGFEAEDLSYDFTLLRAEARLPVFHPSNPRLDTPRRVWSKLPPFVANRVGARLSRYLP